MTLRLCILFSLMVALLTVSLAALRSASACCPAPKIDKSVVNADQEVIIVWDAKTKMQHFIRKANFSSDADDFGFIVPSPARPELSESGNDAFPYLRSVTTPEVNQMPFARDPQDKGSAKTEAVKDFVKVIEKKLVAGFDATVLETNSAKALVGWLKENGYAYTTEVEAWAKPYIESRWLFTALKVVKNKDSSDSKSVSAGALRMSFKTERPLFPYREPDSRSAAELLGAKRRLLRIYFIAEARYEGRLTGQEWTGKVVWFGSLGSQQRTQLLDLLKLPADTGPTTWWLTEFEDYWPYRVAASDLYFSKSAAQDFVRRWDHVQFNVPSSTDSKGVAPAPAAKSSELADSPEAAPSPTGLPLPFVLGGFILIVAPLVFLLLRKRQEHPFG